MVADASIGSRYNALQGTESQGHHLANAHLRVVATLWGIRVVLTSGQCGLPLTTKINQTTLDVGFAVSGVWFTSWERLSGRLRRLQSEARLDRLAHHEFLNLAGDGHREFVDEFHVARNFVMRDLSLTETANLLSGQRLP